MVEEDQLSLAIGRAGQNVRLAAKLTGWKIDILSEEEYRQRQAEMTAMLVDIADLPGLGKKLVEEFERAGVESVQDMVKWDEKRLQQIPGVGPATAKKLRQAAKELIDRVEAEHLEVLRTKARTRKAAGEEESEEELSAEEPKEAPEKLAARGVSVSKLRGIGPKLVQELQQAGIESLEDLAEADEESLLEVPGVGPATAQRLLKTAEEGMQQIHEAIHDQEESAHTESADEESADEESADADEDNVGEDSAGEEASDGEPESEEKMAGTDTQIEDELQDDDHANDDHQDLDHK